MKPKHYWLVFISCVLTLLYLFLYHQSPTSDSALYQRLADLYRQGIFFDPKGNYFGHQLYSVFLLVTVSIIKYNFRAVALIQTLIFSFSAIFLVRQLEKHYKRDLFGLTLLLFLIPDLQHYNGTVITESITMTFMLLGFGMAMKIYNEGITALRLLFISFIVGFTLLTRTESAVMLLPILYIIYPQIKEKILVSLSILAIVPLCALLLIGYINYKTFEQFRITSFSGGEVLFGGNSENLDGSFHVFYDHKEVFIPKENLAEYDSILALPPKYSYPARNVFYTRLVKEAWKKSPSDQLSVIPEKFGKNWLIPASFDMYTSDTTKTRGLQLKKLFQKEYFNNAWYAPWKHLVYLLIYWITLAIILIGVFTMNRKDKFQAASLLIWAIFILFTIPFCGLPRWHMPIYPILILAFTPKWLTEWINRLLNRIIKQ